jgi:hypothetical protein
MENYSFKNDENPFFLFRVSSTSPAIQKRPQAFSTDFASRVDHASHLKGRKVTFEDRRVSKVQIEKPKSPFFTGSFC